MTRAPLRDQVWLTLWAITALVLVALTAGIRPANGAREAIVAHDDWARDIVERQVASQQEQQTLRAEIRSLRAEMQQVLRVLREDARRP